MSYPLTTRETTIARTGKLFRSPPQNAPGDTLHLCRVQPNFIKQTSLLLVRRGFRIQRGYVSMAGAHGVAPAHKFIGKYYAVERYQYEVAEISWGDLEVQTLSTHPTKHEALTAMNRQNIVRRYNWQPYGAEFHCAMPGNITLVASPDRVSHFGSRPARGTTWHAQASHWDEATRTSSRYGRDEYGLKFGSAVAAKRAAESIYEEQQREEKQAAEQQARLAIAAGGVTC